MLNVLYVIVHPYPSIIFLFRTSVALHSNLYHLYLSLTPTVLVKEGCRQCVAAIKVSSAHQPLPEDSLNFGVCSSTIHPYGFFILGMSGHLWAWRISYYRSLTRAGTRWSHKQQSFKPGNLSGPSARSGFDLLILTSAPQNTGDWNGIASCWDFPQTASSFDIIMLQVISVPMLRTS